MLKIRKPRNAYDILGLPQRATLDKIKARYGHLIRTYKKDLPPDQLLEDEQFRRWTSAYLLLTGPERVEYDRRLRQNKGQEQPPDLVGQLSEGRRLLIQTEIAFLQRKLNDAVELGREALKRESRNADAYGLMGDVLREQGRYTNALTMYNYAVQFAPNNRYYWQRVQEATALRDGKVLPKTLRAERGGPLRRPLWAWMLVGLAVVAVEASVLMLRRNWGDIGVLNLPVNLTYAALADGFLLGLALALTSLIGPLDDELLSYQVAGFGAEIVPLAIFVALPGIVFFWVAIPFYLIVAALDEHFSVSILVSFGVCALLTLTFGFLAPAGSRTTVYLLAGNFVFFGFLWGWLIGSARLRVFEH